MLIVLFEVYVEASELEISIHLNFLTLTTLQLRPRKDLGELHVREQFPCNKGTRLTRVDRVI